MTRHSNRRATAMAALSAAAMLVTTAQQSSAQVWNAPNSGDWTTTTNWVGGVAPVSSAATVLSFPGTGYNSNNNSTNPFQFASLTTTNSGAGSINITGNPFTGGAGTTGAYIRVDNTGTGSSIFSNGGTLYSMRVGQGSMSIAGGNWSMLSTQRHRDDPTTALPAGNSGFWSLDVGDTAGQTARFIQTGGTISGTIGGFFGNEDGATGIGTFTGASTVANVTDGRFGVNRGNGSISILAGAKVNTRLIEAGRNTGAVSDILVSGAGSQLNGFNASTSGQLFMGRVGTVSSKVTIANGASVFVASADNLAGINSHGQVITAAAIDGVATLNILSGGSLSMPGNFFANDAADPTTGDPFNSTTFVTVDGAGSRLNLTQHASSGTTTLSGGQLAMSWLTGGTSTITFSNGGVGDGFVTLIGNGGIVGGGVATMNVAAGGQYNAHSDSVIESQDVPSAVIVNGGTYSGQNVFMSTNANDRSLFEITNNGRYTSTGQFQVGGSGGTLGSVATVNISGNGVLNASGGSSSLVSVYELGTVNVGSGTSKGTLISDTVAVDGTISFNAGTLQATGTFAVGGSVLLSNAGRAANGTASNKKMVEAGGLELTTTGVIDLNDNDMLIHALNTDPADPVTPFERYRGYIRTARNGGLWNMPGITSTAAKNAVPKNKNLGIITGADFIAGGGSTFNGKTVVASDSLIKFTFNGDTDLNGKVDFDDYSHTDNGFNNNRTGWFNGDFDYNGVVDFDDYSLIDQAFNTQGSVVLNIGDGGLAGPAGDRSIASAVAGFTSELATHAEGVRPWREQAAGGGQLQAVPEPATLGLAGVALLGALSRRRRSVR